jgi:hypothetical protein
MLCPWSIDHIAETIRKWNFKAAISSPLEGPRVRRMEEKSSAAIKWMRLAFFFEGMVWDLLNCF